MSDKKITDLVVSPAAAATDLHEVANVTGVPVSQKQSNAQLATFMQTAMALVQLSGGNIKLNADGSASFAGVAILFNADGSCTFASANAGFAADGALNLPKIHLLADGSAQFANGATTIASDGSAIFSNGQLTLGGTAPGFLTVNDGAANPQVILNGATGSGTFAVTGGNPVQIADSQVTIGGTQVITTQQPAIADATNAVDVITQFNTLLAELRTHGLIAP